MNRQATLVVCSVVLAACGSSTASSAPAATRPLNPAQQEFLAWVRGFIAVKSPETAAIGASARFNEVKNSGTLAVAY
jgi:hypothetical protein